jgi:hypothetical protein
MNLTTSSIFSHVIIGKIGPKISSVIIKESVLGSTTSVGATYLLGISTWPRIFFMKNI